MDAFQQNGIPTVFIINKKGQIVWVGSPFGDFNHMLDKVASGQYDLAAIKARMAKLDKIRSQLQAFDSLCRKGDAAKVNDMAKGFLKDSSDTPELLGNAAWIMLNRKQLKNPDYKLALKLSEAALKADTDNVPDLYHIDARARYLTGDKEGAIAMQQKAVNLAEDPQEKSFFEKALKEYKGGDTMEGSGTTEDSNTSKGSDTSS